MEETTIKEQIKKLVDLQKIDEQIYDFKRDLKEKPQVIEELKQEFEDSKSTLNALEDALKNILVGRKDFELELQVKEEGIAKANGDLSAIKTNKEYTAKVTEIESLKADKSQVEDKILNSYDSAEEAQKKIDAEKKNVEQNEKVYLEKKKEVEAEIAQIEGNVKELEAQRTGIVPEIDKDILIKYERILENKGGRALVPIENGVCGGCYMGVTPQMINVVKLGEELNHCEVCARILYLEEDQ